MNTEIPEKPIFDYFHKNENEQFLFIQLPFTLIRDNHFKGLSDGAKILYSLLLNRTSLSIKNDWIDEQNRVYIIYTIEDIMDDLSCWKEKANKSMKELKSIGLVKTIRQGLGKPNLIYVMNFATALKYRPKDTKEPENPVTTQKFENRTSEISKTELQKVRKSNSIYINNNNINGSNIKDQSSHVCPVREPTLTSDTDGQTRHDTTIHSDTLDQVKENKKEELPKRSPSKKTKADTLSINPDYNAIEKKIKSQIMYDQLLKDHRFKQREIDELVNVMIDVHMTVDQNIRIDGETKPLSLVRRVYDKLRYEHIIYAIEQFNTQTDTISNKRKYLRTTLFNAVHELTSNNNNLFNTGAFG